MLYTIYITVQPFHLLNVAMATYNKYIYLSYFCLGYGANLCRVQNGQMAALCVAIVCDSNTHHGPLQTRRKSYWMKRTLQPLTQVRIQVSEEIIAPTNLSVRLRITQDPKRSSLQITPIYNAHRNASKKNTQQHNCFWAFWESFFTQLMQREHIYTVGCTQGSIPKYVLISPASII